ncbi:MAG: chromosomal replication initiator protein DnaA [Deltaproteobacteria bacterium]|nr:chromosomal replication initiator protein DnaA [Deltaproteobacteria bacterium]
MNNIWNKIKNSIKKKAPAHIFKMWLEPIRFVEYNNGKLILSCPNSFTKKTVKQRFEALIIKEWEKLTGYPTTITFKIKQSNDTKAPKKTVLNQKQLPDIYLRLYGGRPLRKNFTFDNFIVGNNNDFAYSASLSLASKENNSQNSLLLLSKTGMGKSHLSQAIGRHILTSFSNKQVCYLTAEDFTNEMVTAIQTNCLDKFKDKYRKHCDVLLIEDIDFFSGKKRSQQELSLVLDSLFDSDKKIIFTSQYLPAEIPKLDDGLSSRLTCGIISNISKPDFKTRLKILKKKTEIHNYDKIPKQVIEYLAGELTGNVRQLESGLLGVITKASLLGLNIDIPLAKEVIDNIVGQYKVITLDYIKKEVCKHYGILPEDITSKSRKQPIVRPRQVAMYLARKYTDQPLAAIGNSFNRYHATVLHAINEIEKGIRHDPTIRGQIDYFRNKLASPSI